MHQQAPSTHTLRRSSKIRQIPERDRFLIEDDEPTSHKEVMCDINFKRWLEAMKSEMDSIYDNYVWTLVNPPEGVKPIGCKWVFKRKIDMEGNMITYKARLVTKGYK